MNLYINEFLTGVLNVDTRLLPKYNGNTVVSSALQYLWQ